VRLLKNYNVLQVLAQHKWLFGSLTLIYPLVYVASPMAFVRGWAFGVCLFIAYAYFVIVDAYYYWKVLYYVQKNLPVIYHKYEIARRIYFRSFSKADIETMLQTPVSAEFIQSYNFLAKLFATMLYFFLLYAIPAMIIVRL